MKKNIFLLVLFAVQQLFAQSEGFTCGTHKKLEGLLQNPTFQNQFWQNRANIQALIGDNDSSELVRSTIYTIPVVFHVLHNGGDENISREQILDALEVLNRDYRKLNTDVATVHQNFQDIAADIEIEFKLATKAPNGQCFNGITRTQSDFSFNEDGWGQVDAIINGNDVYQGEWPGDSYLNFFICGAIGFGAAGYTYLPGSIGESMYNGIWVLHEYVGRIGTSDEGRSRVLTHEVGHWLDLPHTWGYTNDPGLPDNCFSDDEILDTPNTIGSTWCNLNENTCGEIANVENYMDYSYCSKMFTLGQKDRMRATLSSGIDNRNNLWTNTNLINTGTFEEPYLCKATFTQDMQLICQGEDIQFTDLSYNKAVSWNWYFEGGNPSTSTEQHPIVSYLQTGTFDVKLVVSDGTNSDSVTVNQAVIVNNPSLSLPFSDDFDSYTSLSNQNVWKVSNPQLNNAFEITNQAAFSETNSVYLLNYFEFGPNTDEIISPNFDLSSIDSMLTLSFFFAYQKYPDVNNEKLQVYVSSDCGKTWILRRTISGTLLYNEENTSSYFPSSREEWQLVHVNNITESYWSPNFLFKFKFSGFEGNNIFIDNVNLYEGPPDETLTQLGTVSLQNESFKIFPNPTNNWFTLYSDNNLTEMNFELIDVLGQKIEVNSLQLASNQIKIDVSNCPSGIYLLKVFNNDKEFIYKLSIK
ncbi:MAG: T9SS type A sorting domain-containing protein [Flavobacteriia bacterium]|nr:T9SS type A sorting domain-containing protein [Flavobacteriia bacterium]